MTFDMKANGRNMFNFDDWTFLDTSDDKKINHIISKAIATTLNKDLKNLKPPAMFAEAIGPKEIELRVIFDLLSAELDWKIPLSRALATYDDTMDADELREYWAEIVASLRGLADKLERKAKLIRDDAE